MDGARARRFAAVLADQSRHLDECLVQLQARSRPGAVGRAAAGHLWGASFPLALAAVSTAGRDAGRLVGGVYAANTIGAVAGALDREPAAGRLDRIAAHPAGDDDRLGPGRSAGLSPRPRRCVSTGGRTGLPAARYGALAAAALLTVLFIRSVPPISGMLVAHGRFAATLLGQAGDIIYVGEGLQSSVAVSRLPTGKLGYHNAGKIQASSAPEDMRLQRMLGHLTTLVPPASAIGAGHRLRGGGHRRRGQHQSAGRAGDDRRNRAARPAGRLDLLQRRELRRRPQPEGAYPHRRRAALPADDDGKIRRHHLRSARSVGEGGGDALHEGVFPGGTRSLESRRRGDAVRAVVRQQSGRGEERDRNVLRGLPSTA